MSEDSETSSISDSGVSQEKTPISLLDAYRIGTLIGYIRYTCQASERAVYTIDDQEFEQNLIKYTIDYIISELESFEDNFFAVKEIERKRDELLNRYEPMMDNGEEGSEPDGKEDSDRELEDRVIYLSEADTNELQRATETWGNLLQKQLKEQTRIPVTEVGLFNAKIAMESPEMLFDDRIIWEGLPSEVTRDLKEACRSLAAGCPTSAVFLSLRALEQRLHEWYMSETDREIEDRTFGEVLGEIDDQYDDGSRPRVLDHLDYLVDRRNEVAHAEETPDQQEAENTLMLTRTTISNISSKLDEEE